MEKFFSSFDAHTYTTNDDARRKTLSIFSALLKPEVLLKSRIKRIFNEAEAKQAVGYG